VHHVPLLRLRRQRRPLLDLTWWESRDMAGFGLTGSCGCGGTCDCTAGPFRDCATNCHAWAFRIARSSCGAGNTRPPGTEGYANRSLSRQRRPPAANQAVARLRRYMAWLFAGTGQSTAAGAGAREAAPRRNGRGCGSPARATCASCTSAASLSSPSAPAVPSLAGIFGMRGGNSAGPSHGGGARKCVGVPSRYCATNGYALASPHCSVVRGAVIPARASTAWTSVATASGAYRQRRPHMTQPDGWYTLAPAAAFLSPPPGCILRVVDNATEAQLNTAAFLAGNRLCERLHHYTLHHSAPDRASPVKFGVKTRHEAGTVPKKFS
jgi:hypothetical protein